MVKIVISDHSGVLSDDTQPVYEANMMLLRDYARDRISFEEWKQLSALTAAGFLRNCGIENVDERKTYERYKQYFRELVAKGMHPRKISGVDETLEYLVSKGMRLILLSSHPHVNLVAETANYEIQGFFELIIGDVTDKATSLADVCSRMEFDRSTVLYVGDTVYDLQAARAAGVLAGAVSSGYHSYERLDAEKPDFMLEELSWLRGVF